jgi:8-oxo-dGTP pyrophosphatase MutT (NUDIX family)
MIRSAGIIVFRDGAHNREYLLLHYPHGHWDFAKGKIEGDETDIAAAHRELDEETGLQASLIEGFQETYSYSFTEKNGEQAQKTVILFLGRNRPFYREPWLSHEHVQYAWLPYEQALARLTYDNSQEVLKKAEQYLTK